MANEAILMPRIGGLRIPAIPALTSVAFLKLLQQNAATSRFAASWNAAKCAAVIDLVV